MIVLVKTHLRDVIMHNWIMTTLTVQGLGVCSRAGSSTPAYDTHDLIISQREALWQVRCLLSLPGQLACLFA